LKARPERLRFWRFIAGSTVEVRRVDLEVELIARFKNGFIDPGCNPSGAEAPYISGFFSPTKVVPLLQNWFLKPALETQRDASKLRGK
jgi:hypothetical protein